MGAIFTRRSIRNYLDKTIERENIELLLRAAMQAPSAGNQQPWEFLVVQNKGILKLLSNMSPYSQALLQAPLAIIFLANQSKLKHPKFWEQDMAAATQNLLLQAVELNLGAVWLGIAPDQYRMDFIKKSFDLPNEIMPFSVVCLGYSVEQNKNNDRFIQQKIHYESY